MPSGNIEGQKAPVVLPEGAEVVEETAEVVDENAEVIDEEEVTEGEEAIDEKISTNGARERQAGGDLTSIKGPGAVQTAKNLKHETMVKNYNTLLAEAKAYKAENDMFRASLKGFRKQIVEQAIFSTNLVNVTRLFVEHSTTSAEKKNILERFDNEVSSIVESKKLYKNIVSELGAKTPIAETVERKIVAEQTTSQSSQLNEHTAYVDPAQKRILDLMNRTK